MDRWGKMASGAPHFFWGGEQGPKFQGIFPQNMARNMVLTYLHVLDPQIPIDGVLFSTRSSLKPSHELEVGIQGPAMVV